MADGDSQEREQVSISERIKLVDVSRQSLAAYFGFGVFFIWLMLGLYGGYPVFIDGNVDALSCVLLGASFSTCLFAAWAFAPFSRMLCLRGGLLGGGIIAAVGCLGLLLACTDLVDAGQMVYLVLVRCSMVAVGLGAAILLLHCGLFFSCMEPQAALLTFCLSYLVSFFLFFCVGSFNFPIGQILFALMPLAVALSLAPSSTGTLARVEEGKPEKDQYSQGYVRMLLTFAVFAFAISLAQGLEPPFDFAVGFDDAIIYFFLVLVAVFWALILAKRNIGTFKVLKRLYQVATICLVLRLCISSIVRSDAIITSLYVVTYFTLFLVFWQLTAFVGHAGDLSAPKAVALVFAVAGICMALGWPIGSYLRATIYFERYIVSIALSCAVTVFCVFGFSVKDFPHLTISGEGMKKLLRSEDDEDEVETLAQVNTDDAIKEIAETYKLTNRETEIFTLLIQGMAAEEIADELVISYYTVRTHIRNLYSKLGVSSRGEMFSLLVK